MTTFAEMRTEVIANTRRPELVALTDSAIKMATLRAHHVDFFPRDVGTYPLTYTVPTGNQLFVDIASVNTLIPDLRTLDFMQGYDPITLLANENLEYVVDFKNFWDEYNDLRSSVFTTVGDTLRVRFCEATGKATIYYYKNPDVTVADYSSWIADKHKEEVARWAAAIVWQRSGFQEIAAQMQAAILDFKSLLVESYLSSKV
jgi:hypothetical protein